MFGQIKRVEPRLGLVIETPALPFNLSKGAEVTLCAGTNGSLGQR